MRKLILTITILLFTASLAMGQVALKAFAGTNFSSLSDDPSNTEWTGKAGYQFGAGVAIGDKLYVQPSIVIMRQSRELTITEGQEDLTIDFNQNFVKIPVVVGYHVLGHERGLAALRIFGGPSALIAGTIADGESQIDRDAIKDAQFMLEAGLGVDILFLFAELSYENSFSEYFDSFSGTDAKHRSVGINVGVHFDF